MMMKTTTSQYPKRQDPKQQQESRRQRNLFQKTGLDDNYTPEHCFLAAIQRNKNVIKHTLGQCIVSACQVSLQLNSLLLFLLSYFSLDQQTIGPELLALIAGSLAALGYLLDGYFCNSSSLKLGSLVQDARNVVVFCFFGLGLSPVLHKLTDTISTDTIYTTGALMMLVHLLFHNYDPRKKDSQNALSLNAALFASVCLASRVNSSWEALVLLMISVITFVLFPLVRLRITSRILVLGLTSFGSAVSCGLTFYCSGGFSTFAVLGILAFVTLVAPGLFCLLYTSDAADE